MRTQLLAVAGRAAPLKITHDRWIDTGGIKPKRLQPTTKQIRRAFVPGGKTSLLGPPLVVLAAKIAYTTRSGQTRSTGFPGAFLLKRRDFTALVGDAAAGWPLAALAQQAMPVIGFHHTT